MRKLENGGNVAIAMVNIPGIKKEFQAHSQNQGHRNGYEQLAESVNPGISHGGPELMVSQNSRKIIEANKNRRPESLIIIEHIAKRSKQRINAKHIGVYFFQFHKMPP
ncbi:UNVERIFIED_CONTAM: hypothetical protein ABIC26_004323 [Paenibacillus sp. PvR008]